MSRAFGKGVFMLTAADANIKPVKSGKTAAIFEISPLPKGCGHTLGNALRRVLLSSIEGAALTQVRFEGVPHQFTTLPGVKEDVVELTLNLKRVRLKVHGDQAVALRLAVTGPKKVTAGDLEVPPGVEVINKSQHLATLANRKAKLEAELLAERGVGYVPSGERESAKVGVILLDSIFSPVLRAAYRVEPARVGGVINLDKLVLTIKTDGTIMPKVALMQSSALLQSFFERLASGKERIKAEKPSEEKEAGREPHLRPESVLLGDLQLPTRVVNSLQRAKIATVADIVGRTDEELLAIKNLGEKSIEEIRKILKKEGFE
ncbi:DNA-directed RNA polymerase subunit alpha [Candidatus Parcubacteria bacterium]|nr:DNA-directed RNA polymerase subunit alpha [Candidatus Parcubacteria bacterium]